MIDKMDIFPDWLNTEIKKRGWSLRELGRRAHLSATTISDVISTKAKPGYDFCIGVARAFQLPPEVVLRKAGLLPSITEDQAQDKELLDYFHGLPEDERKRILTIARALYETRAEYRIEEDKDKS